MLLQVLLASFAAADASTTAAAANALLPDAEPAHHALHHSALRPSHAGRSFTIAQIADVHLEGNAVSDGASLDSIRQMLDAHPKIDLAVLSGDQITAQHLDTAQLQTWASLTGVLAARNIPHTALLGNHDAEPYIPPGTHLDGDAYRAYQDGATGATAHVSREQLMDADASQRLSHSSLSPAALRPASSAYILDVLPHQNGTTPLLSIVHLDTGGGGTPEAIRATQARAVEQELAARRRLRAATRSPPPVLVFGHIPLHAFAAAWQEGQCWGEKRDVITPPHDGDGDTRIMRAIDASPEVVGVFAGHDHCNDFCCRRGAAALCYGRHSSSSGYTCDDYPPGLRLIELTSQPDGSWQLETRIALVNGSIVHRAVLARSEGGDDAMAA